jgi:uncharacterized protein
MIHPDTELRYINDKIGYGVVATRLIPKGTITWALDKLDRTFTPNEFRSLDKVYQDILEKYTYRNNKGELILCWDNARFVNHSFNSSCISTAYEFEIAVRNIHPGEELTDDYGYLNVTEPFDCLPENGSSRTRVMPDDLLNFHKEWDAKLEDSFKNFNNVKQPLKFILDKNTQQTAENIANGKIKMESILSCYFDSSKILR